MDSLTVLQMAHSDNSDDIQASKDSTVRRLAVMPKPKKAAKKERRTRGSGTLFLRGNIWWFELHYAGQRYRESLNTDDKKQAQFRMDDRIKAIRSGEEPKKFEPVTVQSLFENWMVEVERTAKPRTVDDYKSRWAHLAPTFGKLFATQVNKDLVTKYLVERKKAGAGPVTQNRENRVLQMIFGHNEDKIPADRFPQFPSMHSEKARVRTGRLSDADYKTLQAALNQPKMAWLKGILTLTYKFGFRKNELLTAKVSYFDAKASTFTLPAFTTKNDMPRRVDIKRDGEIYRMLVALTDGRGKDEALFVRSNGKPVLDYRGAWEQLTKGMTGGSGIGGCITIHDLRRSAITGMSEKGVTAAQAGTHLTPDVFNRYISRNEAERQQTAAKIEGD